MSSPTISMLMQQMASTSPRRTCPTFGIGAKSCKAAPSPAQASLVLSLSGPSVCSDLTVAQDGTANAPPAWDDARVLAGMHRQLEQRERMLAAGAARIGWKLGLGA